jgi:cleavage and polyadenylation specificity factor subunit 1
MVYSKEQKGPVTAITHVLGFLVSAVGQKVSSCKLFLF